MELWMLVNATLGTVLLLILGLYALHRLTRDIPASPRTRQRTPHFNTHEARNRPRGADTPEAMTHGE